MVRTVVEFESSIEMNQMFSVCSNKSKTNVKPHNGVSSGFVAIVHTLNQKRKRKKVQIDDAENDKHFVH